MIMAVFCLHMNLEYQEQCLSTTTFIKYHTNAEGYPLARTLYYIKRIETAVHLQLK